MKPIKPKYEDTVKIELNISKRTKEILSEYSKYTGYENGEIINKMAIEIISDDVKFVKWLKTRRYKKKINELIFQFIDEEVNGFEKTDETCDF